MKKYIKNNIAITGEIDIKGNVKKIGGLKSKIEGSRKEGIKTFIYPLENENDIKLIIKNNPLFNQNITLIPVVTIDEIIDIIFV